MEQDFPTTEFKTLGHQDPQFEAYLLGTFSKERMAVPVRTLNVRSLKEEVTFELIDKKNIKSPAFALVLLKLLRPQTLTFSVGTIVVAYSTALKLHLPIELGLSLMTLSAVLFFHAAINLLNDFYDHMKGHDRMNPNGGSRVIQRAWISAHLVQKLGFGFLFLSLLLGIPVVLQHSSVVIALAIVSGLAGLEFSTHKLGFKNLGLGEYLVFFLTGPFLTCGFIWATSGVFSWQMIFLGLVFGFVSLFFYHVSNIENILTDAQGGRRTWAVFLGIDRSKQMLWVLAGLVSLSYFSFVLSLSDKRSTLIFSLLFLIIAANMILICLRANQSNSPLSSDLESLRHRSLRLHWLMIVCMIVALT